jgi:hypothetical protein
MTDIVKRLRSPVSQENDIFLGQRPGEEVKSYDMVRFDGSYEIERLRAALVDCRVELDDYYMREFRSDDPIIQQRLEEKMASNPARVALEKKHD